MIVAEFKTLDALWFRVVDKFIQNDGKTVDKAWSPRLFSFNNLLRSRSAEFNFDFSWVGLTRPRWARFLHSYVDRDDLVEFLDKVRLLRRGAEVGLYTRRDTAHDWGSCLMGVSFMAVPDPHVSVFSRTSSFAQTGIVDLAFAHIIAREAGRISAIPLNRISINWYCSSLFISTLHIIPYLTYAERIDEILALAKSDPTNKFAEYASKLYLKYFEARKETPYGPTIRMVKRHDQISSGTLASTPIESLDLSPVLDWRGTKIKPESIPESVAEGREILEEVRS